MPSEDLYRDLVENMHDGIYFVDRERRITYWNKGAERITGYSAAEVVGKSCADNILVHVDALGRQLCKGSCPLVASMADGAPHEAEVYLHHKQGHRLPVWVRTSPLPAADGTVLAPRGADADQPTGDVPPATTSKGKPATKLKMCQDFKKMSLYGGFALYHLHNKTSVRVLLQKFIGIIRSGTNR